MDRTLSVAQSNNLSSPYLFVISLSPPFIIIDFQSVHRIPRFFPQLCVSLKLDTANFSLLFVEIDKQPNARTGGF